MTRKEKFKALQELRDPNLKALKLLTKSISTSKDSQNINEYFRGPAGIIPIKGTDYFTQEEIANIITFIQSEVKDGEPGQSGDKGDKGDSIVGEKGDKGNNGLTPQKGIDYFTKEDKALFLSEALKQIKIPSDGISPDINDIVAKVVSLIPKQSLDEEVVTVDKLAKFLQRGGFRGGAGSGVSASTQISKIFPYNPDGTLLKMLDNLGSKTFTYSSGILIQLIGTGAYKSKTFVYNGSNQLINVNVI